MQEALRDDDPEIPSPVIGPSKPRLLRVLGPGLITGASDDDPSGIATYAQAGAAFGYRLGWTLLYSFPLMVAVQMISARIGRTTGHGIAGVLQRHAPNGLLQLVVVLLLIANTVNLGADLGAMADAVTLLLPGSPRWLLVLLFAGICVFLQVLLAYARYVAVLKWLTLALFAYFAALAMMQVDWPAFAFGIFVPQVSFSQEEITTVVAIFGTTISPYLFFWQSSEEAEDLHVHPQRRDLLHAPEQGPPALRRIEIDTLTGMGMSNLVALAILGTGAAALHAHGTLNIQTSAEAAAALRPVAGRCAEAVFALGVIGVGLLAVPVLAGSSAYAVGEARRWPVGFSRRVQEAKAFYGVVGLATLVGMLISLMPNVDPVQALFWSAVLNGVVAVPVMAVMMRLAARTDVMGPFAVTGWLKGLGWLATLVMALAAVGMIITLVG